MKAMKGNKETGVFTQNLVQYSKIYIYSLWSFVHKLSDFFIPQKQ